MTQEEVKNWLDRVEQVQQSKAMEALIEEEGFRGDFVDYVAWGVAQDIELTDSVLAGETALFRDMGDEDAGDTMFEWVENYNL
jgi:hypothetical protein